MKIKYKGREYDLHFNDHGSMFSLEQPRTGKVKDYICARALKVPNHNQAWVLLGYLNMLVEAEVVTPVMDGPNLTEDFDLNGDAAVLVDIIHPIYNDQGYGDFGDFARSRLHQQCQYASRYIDGRLDDYPALGKGLRFHNGVRTYSGISVTRLLDTGDYHSVQIHRDDMDEFERRYRAHQEEARL